MSDGFMTPPTILSTFAISEGDEWFNCHNCYSDFYKEETTCNRINTEDGDILLCNLCNSTIGWYFETPELVPEMEINLGKTFVPVDDVDWVAKALMRDAKKKAEEIAEKEAMDLKSKAVAKVEVTGEVNEKTCEQNECAAVVESKN